MILIVIVIMIESVASLSYSFSSSSSDFPFRHLRGRSDGVGRDPNCDGASPPRQPHPDLRLCLPLLHRQEQPSPSWGQSQAEGHSIPARWWVWMYILLLRFHPFGAKVKRRVIRSLLVGECWCIIVYPTSTLSWTASTINHQPSSLFADECINVGGLILPWASINCHTYLKEQITFDEWYA